MIQCGFRFDLCLIRCSFSSLISFAALSSYIFAKIKQVGLHNYMVGFSDMNMIFIVQLAELLWQQWRQINKDITSSWTPNLLLLHHLTFLFVFFCLFPFLFSLYCLNAEYVIVIECSCFFFILFTFDWRTASKSIPCSFMPINMSQFVFKNHNSSFVLLSTG